MLEQREVVATITEAGETNDLADEPVALLPGFVLGERQDQLKPVKAGASGKVLELDRHIEQDLEGIRSRRRPAGAHLRWPTSGLRLPASSCVSHTVLRTVGMQPECHLPPQPLAIQFPIEIVT